MPVSCASITRTLLRQGIPFTCAVGSALILELIDAVTPGPRDEITYIRSPWATMAIAAAIVLLTRAGVDYAIDHCWPSSGEVKPLLNRKNSARFLTYRTSSWQTAPSTTSDISDTSDTSDTEAPDGHQPGQAEFTN